MFQDLSGERGALHGGDVPRPVEGNIQMTQLPSLSVGEVQRLVTSSRLQAFETMACDLRLLSYQRCVSTCQQNHRVIIHLREPPGLHTTKTKSLKLAKVGWAKVGLAKVGHARWRQPPTPEHQEVDRPKTNASLTRHVDVHGTSATTTVQTILVACAQN